MKNYEITYKGNKYKVKGEKMVLTMIDFCEKESIDLNEIESCVLVSEKEIKPIKLLSETLISELTIVKEGKNCYEIIINLIGLNEKGDKNIDEFYSRLFETQKNNI